MREKTGAVAALRFDGRWEVEGGNPIIRSSVKLYRNGLRMTEGVDYALDPGNPHLFKSMRFIWTVEDIIVMDYLY